MNIVYARYNKHYPEKLEKIKDKLKKYGNVYPAPVTSGKKLLKKEIKEIDSIIQKYNPDTFYIYYLDKNELEKLKNYKIIRLLDDELKEQKKDISHKLTIMFEILKELTQRSISTNEDYEWFNDIILRETGKDTTKTTFLNYLDDISSIFPDIIKKERYKDGYKFYMENGENFIKEFYEKVDNVYEITILLTNIDDEILKNLSKRTQKLIKSNKEFLIYKTNPFEKFENKIIFSECKRAINEKRYLDIYGYKKQIEIEGYEDENYEDVIPLKIVFMENNWYLAGVYKNIVRFFRLAFIDDILAKEHYPPKSVKKSYLNFLENFQTPFTLYNAKFKKAILKIVGKNIYPYFKYKDIFPLQKIIKEEHDFLIIETKYTQPLEILPTIKKWLPNIIILESENNELQQQLIEDLKETLNFYS